MKIYFVVPDSHATRPKRCVNGWETTFLNIAPDGVALPCHEARMREPCRSCPEKWKDLGGCRCQAYLLAGDATNAAPVCDLSPEHARITQAEVASRGQRSLPLLFRSDENSRRLLAARD
jgi:pyrroloquinoline quinone biosynthesis protein E